MPKSEVDDCDETYDPQLAAGQLIYCMDCDPGADSLDWCQASLLRMFGVSNEVPSFRMHRGSDGSKASNGQR